MSYKGKEVGINYSEKIYTNIEKKLSEILVKLKKEMIFKMTD